MPGTFFQGYTAPVSREIIAKWYGSITHDAVVDLLDESHLNKDELGGFVITIFDLSFLTTQKVEISVKINDFPSGTLTQENGIRIWHYHGQYKYIPGHGGGVNDGRITTLEAIAIGSGPVSNVEVLGLA